MRCDAMRCDALRYTRGTGANCQDNLMEKGRMKKNLGKVRHQKNRARVIFRCTTERVEVGGNKVCGCGPTRRPMERTGKAVGNAGQNRASNGMLTATGRLAAIWLGLGCGMRWDGMGWADTCELTRDLWSLLELETSSHWRMTPAPAADVHISAKRNILCFSVSHTVLQLALFLEKGMRNLSI
ncbi:hypothetical protein VFPPC_01411 [Pochonia chlamydosporia 170]|uniref:Uncharacterized protein n=1 Tax=Pochonia chlamydosporia 170 TaxID=1380566 RepID=A0A179G7M0_METCM|nr:hypothetical protein VFPPC_01411 [Pochonia chlamydosporia 170]OAQ73785.1 hypothetical protein VFPPC_01411 [Pochonia chlamydosporia 170]